jgi:hypothetical protein
MNPVPTSPTPAGTLDGSGAGDHDVTYTFGRRPRASAPYPFSTRQYARLLILRARLSATHPAALSGSGSLEGAA